MSLFQLVAIPLLMVMVLISARNLFQRARLLASLAWTLLWLAGILAVINPDETTEIAKLVGIRRGADLLIYTAVLGFGVGFYVVSLRLRQMSREITLLTREVALLEADRKTAESNPPS
jgi:small membrane protein